MSLKMDKKGLTILEIVVSVLLLALVLVGLANVFVAAKRRIFHARARVVASERVKGYLEPLQMQVDQTKYSVVAGNYEWYPSTLSAWIDSSTMTTYTPNYEINPMDLDSDPDTRVSEINRVSLKINWDERTAE